MATAAAATTSLGSALPMGMLCSGQSFGVRYRVIRQLGVGGMGAVYEVWDAELNVAVALKVVRPDLMADAHDAERRFKRELLLARKVTHKNVLRIHDLGEIDGIKYITMPFLDGSDLGVLLRREGRLPISRVVAIARQIASGLEAAHEVGIVHRDLKPANIMIEPGDRTSIMDFGIARSMVPGATVATMEGSVVGTLDYMAPEQARGETVDHRADIYAFGLIVYDMLLGPRPNSGPSPFAALMERLQKPMPAPRSIDPQIPEALNSIVSRCLEANPAARYQATSELVAALDAFSSGTHNVAPVRVSRRSGTAWAGAATLAALLLVGTTWWVATTTLESNATAAQPVPVSVLIADFDNRTSDSVFEGSLEQVLGLGIEGAGFITAYPRQAAQRVVTQIGAGTRLTADAARLVALREGIKVVLSGEIAPAGSGYRISVSAVDPAVESGGRSQLAHGSVEAKNKAHVLEAVQDLAATVRRGLGDASVEAGAAAARETFSAGSLEAARAYAQAQDLASSGREREATALYREASTKDPNFGRAYASWAVAAYRLGNTDEAELLWKKALALMDRMTERERFRTLGTYHFGVTRNYELAVENYEALLKRYPADASGLNNLGIAYFETLNFTKAVEQGRRAVDVYPRNALYRQNLALYLMYAGDFAAAAKEAAQVIATNSALHKAHLAIATTAFVGAKVDEALEAYRRMAASGPRGASLAAIGVADVAMYRGRFDEAESVLTRNLADEQAAGAPRERALKHAMLGELQLARGRRAEAGRSAHQALALADTDDVLVSAALVLRAAGQEREAEAIATRMRAHRQKRTRALGNLIAAEVAAERNRTVEALDLLTEAKALADLWPVRFALGRVYAQAGSYAEALAELNACVQRSGEATSAYLTDVPTYRYVVPLLYWHARSQEGVGMKEVAASGFKAYLNVRGHVGSDSLAADARQRITAH
jgi:tetratricopeptide (TPR) repeat protein